MPELIELLRRQREYARALLAHTEDERARKELEALIERTEREIREIEGGEGELRYAQG
jgi:hypothetical protein